MRYIPFRIRRDKKQRHRLGSRLWTEELRIRVRDVGHGCAMGAGVELGLLTCVRDGGGDGCVRDGRQGKREEFSRGEECRCRFEGGEEWSGRFEGAPGAFVGYFAFDGDDAGDRVGGVRRRDRKSASGIVSPDISLREFHSASRIPLVVVDRFLGDRGSIATVPSHSRGAGPQPERKLLLVLCFLDRTFREPHPDLGYYSEQDGDEGHGTYDGSDDFQFVGWDRMRAVWIDARSRLGSEFLHGFSRRVWNGRLGGCRGRCRGRLGF